MTGILLASAGLAQAGPLSATLTADNHYGLYHGQADGGVLSFVGRNEFGDDGSPGTFNWSLAESYFFNVSSLDRLYVVAWDDGGPQSWIGEFTLPNSSVLRTNVEDWEYTLGPAVPSPFNNAPVLTVAQLSAVIASAT